MDGGGFDWSGVGDVTLGAREIWYAANVPVSSPSAKLDLSFASGAQTSDDETAADNDEKGADQGR
jgi:hypothetical protein